MPTGNVFTTHQSGGLGQTGAPAERVMIKFGDAELGTPNEPVRILNFRQAKDTFGAGSLVESLRQHFEEFNASAGEVPPPILCVAPLNDVAGSVALPVKTGTGAFALPTIAGTPTGTRRVVLRITKEGACGVAEYRRSVDGGVTFEAPLVTPASGVPISLAVGVTAAFADAATPADTFDVGDEVVIVITGPHASDASMLDAVEANKRNYDIGGLVHIVGGRKRPFAVSLHQILYEMAETHHLPVRALVEMQDFATVMPPATAETEANLALYWAALQAEWDPFRSERVLVVGYEGRYVSGGVEAYGGFDVAIADNVGEWRNMATYLLARAAASPVHRSAAFVELNRSRTFSQIRYWEQGAKDYADVFHDLGFTVLKSYDDYPGVYVARDLIRAPEDSDFKEMPEARIADKFHRLAYRTSLPYLNADNGEIDFDYLSGIVMGAISQSMMVPGAEEIKGFDIKFDPEGVFLTTGVLWVSCKIYIGQRMKEIRWVTSFARKTA